MLFHSSQFAVFYLLVFAAYWGPFRGQRRAQNLLILAASYFFYGCWDWRFLGLILISSITDYVVAQRLASVAQGRSRRGWLGVSLVVNLGLLGVFKYYGFFVDSLITLFSELGYELAPRTLNIILPVGISFYTFQTLSYTIDVYRGRFEASRDPIAFLAFVGFFPQLVAGPIERASQLLTQFERPRTFEYERARTGLQLVLWGLFKKVVVADTMGVLVDEIVPRYQMFDGSTLLLGLLFFSMGQLYCDFSGYSDIAVGTARLLGFELSRNFIYPAFSRDIPEFWRRWHITLTNWFRDYVFHSLGGRKLVRNKAKLIRNILITFGLTGLWHGPNWTFVIWGLLHGLYLAPYVLFPKLRVRGDLEPLPWSPRLYVVRSLQIGSTLGLQFLAIVFFLAPSVDFALAYLARMLSASLFTLPGFKSEAILLALFFVWEGLSLHKETPLSFEHRPAWVRWPIYYAAACAVLYFNQAREAFVYFQF